MSPPWMPLYIADYRADTAHLSAAEHGAYLLLIMHYWSTGGLPDDDRPLARIACMSGAEWRRARPTLASFFQDRWTHKRINSELARAAEISSKRRASAEQRYSKRNANAEQVDTHARASPPSPSPREDSEAYASAADAAPAKHPVYTDSRHELWGEGIPILEQLGISEKSARSNIGRWLKDTADDAQAVLGAIQRARDNRAHNAIPWITNALRTPNGQRPNHANRKSPGGDFFAGLAEVAAGLDRDGSMAGPADENIPSGRVNIEH
jgi:uncharacterized protein YdaU (DUF1376 family)